MAAHFIYLWVDFWLDKKWIWEDSTYYSHACYGEASFIKSHKSFPIDISEEFFLYFTSVKKSSSSCKWREQSSGKKQKFRKLKYL